MSNDTEIISLTYRERVVPLITYNMTVSETTKNLDENGQERSSRNEINALKPIVEKVPGTFTFTLQTRKNHCIL